MARSSTGRPASCRSCSTPVYRTARSKSGAANACRRKIANVLHTRICDLLGIKHPVVLGGMGTATNPELVAAVTNAGGLGILSASNQPPDKQREDVKRIRELTGGPFALHHPPSHAAEG